jgi:bicarbonate transport system substrate-binding protein
MNQFSRGKYTAGLSATSTIFLKACGDPPEPGSETTTEQVETAYISPEQMPKTTCVVLGYIPTVKAAALVIAKEKDFFAKYAMTDVELSN